MGETYMNSMYMLEALYSEAWDIADIEYELNGEFSQATLEKLRKLEVEMSLSEVR